MYISPVSFGKKIPVATCKVKNIQRNKFIDATLYELDCKDRTDIKEVGSLKDGWSFKYSILSDMRRKMYLENSERMVCSYFYALENQKNEIIGLAEVMKMYPSLILSYIVSEPDKKYKYVGQNIIGLLGKMALEEKLKEIYIPTPILEARKFYTKKCGFENTREGVALRLSKKGIRKMQAKLKHICKK